MRARKKILPLAGALGICGFVSLLCIGLIGSSIDFGADYVYEPDEIYLIPQDYIGAVVVVFEQSSGQQPQFDGDVSIYRR